MTTIGELRGLAAEAKDLLASTPLKPQQVSRVVEIIERLSDDDEEAHSLEDKLHIAVLREILLYEPENASELAGLALKTCAIKFARWCA